MTTPKTPDPRRKRFDGVRTLSDIRDRCRIDAETGCWNWSLATSTPRGCLTPVVHLAAGALSQGQKSSTMTTVRAAWLLSGKTLPDGHVVWRQVCAAGLCVNPAHCRSGTRPEMHAAVAATGRNRGLPERAACNAISRLRMVTPIDRVRQAEAMFAAGRLQKEVREVIGMSQKTAAAIRQGTHPHSAGRQLLVRGASVFSLGASS